MGCVGDKSTELPLRCLLGEERRFDLTEHCVQDASEPADLALLIRAFDPLREITLRDHGRCPTNRFEWPQAETHDPKTKHRQSREDADCHNQLDHDEAV